MGRSRPAPDREAVHRELATMKVGLLAPLLGLFYAFLFQFLALGYIYIITIYTYIYIYIIIIILYYINI